MVQEGLRDRLFSKILLLALGAFLVVLTRSVLPRIVSGLTGSTTSYYILYSAIIALFGCFIFLLYNRLGRVKSGIPGGLTWGFMAGVIFTLAYLGVGGIVFGYARGAVDTLLGQALFLVFNLAQAALLAGPIVLAGKLVEDRLRSPEAMYVASLLSGAILMALLAWKAVTDLPGATPRAVMLNLIGVILPSFTIGMVAYLISSKGGLAGATVFLWMALHATTSLPITVYGEYLAFGASVIVASYIVLPPLYLLSNPEGAESIDSNVSKWISSHRKSLKVLAVIAAISGIGLLYAHISGLMIWEPLVIVSGSMEPTLNRGDVVILEKAQSSDIGVGDIIAYRIGDAIVTHRVIDVLEDGTLKTKGDANAEPDAYAVSVEQIVGKVKYRIPALGWIVILVNWNNLVRLAVILGATATIAYMLLKG